MTRSSKSNANQTAIAKAAGVSVSTVSRALSMLHDKGILGFLGQTQRQIVLLDRPRLAELDL